jgi:hypothetical protein
MSEQTEGETPPPQDSGCDEIVVAESVHQTEAVEAPAAPGREDELEGVLAVMNRLAPALRKEMGAAGVPMVTVVFSGRHSANRMSYHIYADDVDDDQKASHELSIAMEMIRLVEGLRLKISDRLGGGV